MVELLHYLLFRVVGILKARPELIVKISVFTQDSVTLTVFTEFDPPDFIHAASVHFLNKGTCWRCYITDGSPTENIVEIEDTLDVANFLDVIHKYFNIPQYNPDADGKHH